MASRSRDDAAGQRHALGSRLMVRKACRAAQHGHQQQIGVRQARRRVARHAQHWPAVDASERGRLAGLHRDAVEDHFACLPHRIEHEIALAHGAAPREHEDVRRARRFHEHRCECRQVVGGGGKHLGHAAVQRDRRGQGEAIDVVDLRGSERLAGLDISLPVDTIATTGRA